MNNEAQQISRWRAAFASPDAAPDPASCPTPDTLWSAVRGELPAQEREDLRTVATAKEQTATEYRIPQSALSVLPSGARLLWQVEAVRPDGTHETSPTFVTAVK